MARVDLQAAGGAAYIGRAGRPGGARDIVDGKLVLQRRVPASSLQFDPATFQFKSGGDHQGVTDRLRGVERWNPLAAGKTMVYEYADGRRVIADGHQRTGLAQRLEAGGHAPIKLNAFVMRQVDGWAPPDVRAWAAIKNMQESSGHSVDMAKVMRERPDLISKAALPITDGKLREAKLLAKLSGPAFDQVVAGAVKPEVGAAIAESLPDKGRHADMMGELTKAKVATGQHARLYVQQALAAPQLQETTASLFGEETVQRSLLKERAAVLDRALTSLRGDKRIFGLLDREAGMIEEAGNKLAKGTNVARAQSAGELAGVVEKLATTRGAISSLLDEAAKRVADGDSPSKAARGFVSGLRQMAAGKGAAALATMPTPVPSAASVGSRAAIAGGTALAVLGPAGAAMAGVVAFDSTRNRAMAAGADGRTANTRAAIAGAGTAGVALGVGWGLSKGLGIAARLAPALAPAIAPVAIAGAVAGATYGAWKGWQATGTVKGAAMGSLTGGNVLESMKRKPAAQAAPVRSYERTYRTGPKAGLTERVVLH